MSAERDAPRSPARHRRFVTKDGTALRLRDTGPRDASATLVLLHAWTLTKDSWSRVVAQLRSDVAAGAVPGCPALRVITYDHRGHGESARTRLGTATIDQLADDAAELVAHRVPDGPLVLAGHSLGGMVLMALGQRHPELAERVNGVAFVSTSSGGLDRLRLGLPRMVEAPGLRVERRITGRIGRLHREVFSTRTRWLRPGVRWLVYGDHADAGDLADTCAWIGQCQPCVLAGLRREFDTHDGVEGVRAFRGRPAVVLGGLKDRLCPPKHARAIAAELPAAGAAPDADLQLYAGAGHMTPLERTREVADRIRDVLTAAVRNS